MNAFFGFASGLVFGLGLIAGRHDRSGQGQGLPRPGGRLGPEPGLGDGRRASRSAWSPLPGAAAHAVVERQPDGDPHAAPDRPAADRRRPAVRCRLGHRRLLPGAGAGGSGQRHGRRPGCSWPPCWRACWCTTVSSRADRTTAMLIFRQLFDTTSSTYTYLLGDAAAGEAVLIDPVFEHVQRDTALLRELGLRLVATLDTHVHADHVTARLAAAAALRQPHPAGGCRQRRERRPGAAARRPRGLRQPPPGSARHAGPHQRLPDLRARRPQHGLHRRRLLIRGCGRTDFQQGSPQRLYRSVRDADPVAARRLPALPGARLPRPHRHQRRRRKALQPAPGRRRRRSRLLPAT